MLNIQEIRSDQDFPVALTRDNFIDFLFTHLGRFGDPRPDIERCLSYALSTETGRGGFALAALDGPRPVGALIVNRTGMEGYIPANVLVYVAVHEEMRGRGIGRQLVLRAVELTGGDVKLHVEYDNPAKRLYERLGFRNKYAEMRYEKGE